MYTRIADKLKELGADDVRIVPVSSMHFDRKLASLCQKDICGRYGKSYNCPPYIGLTETLIAEAQKYSFAIVFQTIDKIHGFADFGHIEKAEVRMCNLTKSVNLYLEGLNLGYKLITANCCKRCSPCRKIQGEECLFPNEIFPSVAAYAVDIEKLANNCNMYISWDGKTVSYFSIVLLK